MTDETVKQGREGGLEPPQRHPLPLQDPEFFNEQALEQELKRTFEVCHGCRRCFSLCEAFPTLFDAIDASKNLEAEDLTRDQMEQVVAECYLCDLCFMTKCPYVPPHPLNIDFPHLMLRAKAARFRKGEVPRRDRLLTATDTVGRFLGIPIVAQTVNRMNQSPALRRLAESWSGIHREAKLPLFSPKSLKARLDRRRQDLPVVASADTRGQVALFGTCYGRHFTPEIGVDLVAVFEHNGIPVSLIDDEVCCGMPKLEIGDLDSIDALRRENIPLLCEKIEAGFDLTAPIPSCVLMFKQELPLIYPDDADVQRVARAFFDPFDYLARRHQAGLLRTDFARSLGRVAYHAPCHLRVQNLGLRTRDILALVPGTEIEVIERCSGHNGTYAVRRESHDQSMKIGRPVFRRVAEAHADHYTSDCPMAQDQIQQGLGPNAPQPEHPWTLLRRAYGLSEPT